MSTLRVSNIEAKADASSPTINEKVKITNSNGDVMLQLDGATSGITTVGINTTTAAFTVDGNQNFNFVGIVTAASFSGNLTGDATGLSGSPTLSGITSISTTNLTVNGNAYPNGGPLSSRNKLINGNFDVWQRGTSFTSTVSGTSGYTADRWKAGGGTSTTVSRQSFTLGQTDVPGEPTYYAQWALTNNSRNYEFQQRIEDVRTLAGKQATISFYARRTTGTVTVGVRTVQYFGTGGSPSSSVIVSAGAPSLTSSWQKFTYTVDIASISGKTLGSDNNHSLWVGFQISDTNTGTIEIAQFQLEEGSVATPFEHRSYGEELARCERYFEIIRAHGELCMGYSYTTTNATAPIRFRTVKRDAPDTITLGTAGQTSGTISFLKPDGNYPTTTGTHDVQNITTDGFRIRGNSYVGLTDDRVSPFYAYGNTIVAQVDAEL